MYYYCNIADYVDHHWFVVCVLLLLATGKLSVTNQTEQAVIPAPGHVPLFCVASNHSLHYKYEWTSLTGVVGMNSPVYYANKPGIYRCTVTADRLDQTCLSRSINVIEGIVVELFWGGLNCWMYCVCSWCNDCSTNSKYNPSTSVIDSVENSSHISTSRSVVPHSSHGHTTENQGNHLLSWSYFCECVHLCKLTSWSQLRFAIILVARYKLGL